MVKTETFIYHYTSGGSIIGMSYRKASYAEGVWDTYVYEKNILGDIVAVYDLTGNKLLSYKYDAWGNFTTTYHNGTTANSVAARNPFRYRGYYYDKDLGLYYLQTRYYDSVTGRFINADGYVSTGQGMLGNNMFAYCNNNPVMFTDPTGEWPKLSTVFAVVAITAVVVAVVAVSVASYGTATPVAVAAGGAAVCGITAGVATSIATGAAIVAGVSTVAAVTTGLAEETAEKNAQTNNSVYVLKDETGAVQYVGRTNNVEKRKVAHNSNPARAGLEMEVIASGLNLYEARALEQAGMEYYHTKNTLNKMNNQINGVSPKYWCAFKELAKGVMNYGWNQMSNEILYWTGN